MNEDFTTVESWCDQDGDTFLVGDVNGDHHDDWICHRSDGSFCNRYNSLIFGGMNSQYLHCFSFDAGQQNKQLWWSELCNFAGPVYRVLFTRTS